RRRPKQPHPMARLERKAADLNERGARRRPKSGGGAAGTVSWRRGQRARARCLEGAVTNNIRNLHRDVARQWVSECRVILLPRLVRPGLVQRRSGRRLGRRETKCLLRWGHAGFWRLLAHKCREA